MPLWIPRFQVFRIRCAGVICQLTIGPAQRLAIFNTRKSHGFRLNLNPDDKQK